MGKAENDLIDEAVAIMLAAMQEHGIRPSVAAVAGVSVATIVHKSLSEKRTRDVFMDMCGAVYDGLTMSKSPFPGSKPVPVAADVPDGAKLD